MTSVTDNRTTELLCKLLEEHGLSCQTDYLHVVWRVGPKLYDAVDNFDGTLTVDNLTPEQAIAATLGSEREVDVDRAYVERIEPRLIKGTPTEDIRRWSVLAHSVMEVAGPSPFGMDGSLVLCLHESSLIQLLDMCDAVDEKFSEVEKAVTVGSELNPDGLPVGLTLSEDGMLLNWCGENYVKQGALGSSTLTAEQVRDVFLENFEKAHETSYDLWEPATFNWQAIADELNTKLESDDEYEAKMDALLCSLTNGKWSKSRSYDLDFMVSCVEEEFEAAELENGTYKRIAELEQLIRNHGIEVD